VAEGGKLLNAVIIGSPNVNPGYILVNNKAYPEIATDYEKCFRVLHSLPVDLFLGAHGSYYDMPRKYELLPTATSNPFIDPEGFRQTVAGMEKYFQQQLAAEKAAVREATPAR